MDSAILAQLGTYGPDHCEQLDYAQAHDYTRRLTESHYENFTVVSRLLPRRLVPHFQHVYAFCRWADDLGDETGDPRKSLELLAWWRGELQACYAGRPRHPVFVALAPTVREFAVPPQPFDHLIDAFVQDQTVRRYQTWDQVVDYCAKSANPVGRLVLYLCGYRDEQRQRLADATCTALQLANFWQDVRRDVVDRDRVYIPEEIARRHQLDLDLMVKVVQVDEKERRASCGSASCSCCSVESAGMRAVRPAYRDTIRELVDRTWGLFQEGRGLWPLVRREVRVDIQLFTLGGESILRMIQKQNYDTLKQRPSLSKAAKLALMVRALAGKLVAGVLPGAWAGGAA